MGQIPHHLIPSVVDVPETFNISDKYKLKVRCKCGKENEIGNRSFVRRWKNEPEYRCKSCDVKTYANNPARVKKFQKSFAQIANTEEHKGRCSRAAHKLWDGNDKLKYEAAIRMKEMNKSDQRIIDGRKKATARLKEMYKDTKFTELMSQNKKKWWDLNREKMMAVFDEDFKEKLSNIMNSEEYRGKMALIYGDEFIARTSEISKTRWANHAYRAKMLAIFSSDEYRAKKAINLANQPKVSSIQTILYSILDDLGIKYFREYNDKADDQECVIGPYVFDCVIPRDGQKSLLIECQGDYWHGLDRAIKNDNSKATYVAKNLSDNYELKLIWEHEFKCQDKVIEVIKYWMGITSINVVDFDLKNIEIRKSESKDYKLLLSKYHYLQNAGRGGIAYGAYFGKELVGVCVFSPPIRQNISQGYNCKDNEIRELSRLCIHPKYQKKNFASWLISRCIKALGSKYKLIISYSDSTFNHIGTIYKASNFKKDGVIKSDYWYRKPDGWIMHKKTLYDHAKSLKMTESEFAKKNDYEKVYGNEKTRWLYKIKDKDT